MRVYSARVQNGMIVPDDRIELAEGSRVTVIVGEEGASFELSPEDEAELADAIAEADRGDVVSASELLRRLSRYGLLSEPGIVKAGTPVPGS